MPFSASQFTISYNLPLPPTITKVDCSPKEGRSQAVSVRLVVYSAAPLSC